jgi:alpha-beta hydrolase superfamily lysophospholipase
MEASLAALCGQEGLAGWRQSGRLQVSNELVTCELGWALMEDLARHPAAELADRHRTPTLILQGMRDASVDWREVAAFASRCPPGAVELHLFPAGDHRLIAWKERVWDLAAGFLAPRPSRGREAAR